MNRNYLNMSTESLEIYYRNMLNENVDNESFNENRNEMSISLDDLYDKISLYDYDESNPNDSSRRLTWEEWYLKKKLQALKNKKKGNETRSARARSKPAEESGIKKKLSEEEKKKKLLEWLEEKRKQRKQIEEATQRLKEEERLKKEREEASKMKNGKDFQKWLEEQEQKRQAEKTKQLEQMRIEKQKLEEEKAKKANFLKIRQENMKKIHVRQPSQKIGYGVANGKLRAFYDWSTSPAPSFINKDEWKS